LKFIDHPSNLLRIVNDIYPVAKLPQQPVARELERAWLFAGCLQLCKTDMAVRE
jgi:hypothetical protein